MDPVVFLINENIISVLRFWANVLRLLFLINLYDLAEDIMQDNIAEVVT